MTKENENDGFNFDWFKQLLTNLPTKKLNAAQVFNILADSLGLISLIFLINKIEGVYVFFSLISILLFMFLCHITTMKHN